MNQTEPHPLQRLAGSDDLLAVRWSLEDVECVEALDVYLYGC